jgi:RNA polymerase sigma factor (sigma-70 family)
MTAASSDCELVTAYATKGSEAAFRALVARHVNLVYATALRQVGEPGIAEEISQNVFVVLARKAPRLSGAQTLAGWLHRTTILEAKARIRAELRRKRRDQTAAELALIDRDGAPALDALVSLLDEGLLNLRDSDRLALVLRFLEERSLRDVGAALGVDEDAARKRVARAIDRLTEFFKARGFVASGGATAILAGSLEAAPATLALSAGNAGLAAGGAVTGLKLFLFHLMSLSKTQTAVVCALMAATPLAVQWNTHARVNREHAELASKLNQAAWTMAEIDQEIQSAREAALRNQSEIFGMQGRLVTLDAQRTGRVARPVYRWDDNSPLVRVPKQFLESVPGAGDSRNGKLTDEIKEILQLSETESAQVQFAMSQFLADYITVQSARMRVVPPTAEDLNGHPPEEVLVFELSALGPQLGELRQQLFSALQTSLGDERFPLFRKSLAGWMPLDDEFHGMNTGQTIFNLDRRECFYRPEPGSPNIRRNFSSKQGTMYLHLQIDDISELYRPHLAEWIARARSAPLKGELSSP